MRPLKHIFLLVLVGAFFIALASCSGKPKKRIAAPPVPVLVGKAVRQDIPIQIEAIGTGEADSTVGIKSLVVGQLIKVYFREGDFVRKGQMLFKIDPRPYQAALMQSEANLKRDMAIAQNADEEAKRYAFLVKKDYVAREQYDQFTANAAAQNAVVQADRAMVENNRLQLEYTSIKAPIDGKTGSLMVHGGNVVKANDVDMVVIDRINPIKVSFSIPEQQFEEVKKYARGGTLPVEALIPGDDKPEHGALDFMNNEIDNATGTIRLKGIFQNRTNRLWPGQFVNVVLTLGTQKDAVLVPAEAVQASQNGQFAFVVKPDMTVESRPVTVLRNFKQYAVIANGIAPGDTVVTDGQLGLVPGAKVFFKQPLAGTK